jgi:hypothetical protein
MNKIRKISKLTIAPILITILLNGCALVFKGTDEKVYFNSEPQNSQVYVDGVFMGTAPCRLELESKNTYIIEFKKEGYETKAYRLTNSVNAGYIVLDILFGLVPVIIDAATGAWYVLDDDYVGVTLEKKK